jgi:hypothetical protein
MKYPMTIEMYLSVDEMYELQLSLTKKLKNEELGRKITEQKMNEWAGKGSIAVDNVLLCELNSCELRVMLLTELLSQVKDSFVAAQHADSHEVRRAAKAKKAAES